MNIRECDEGIYVSGQISSADLPTLAEAGIRTVICNRPDREAEEQPDFTHMQQAAAEYDIAFHYIPVTPGGITENNLNEMIAVLTEAERPLLAYCRSGTRSNTICNLAIKHIEEKQVSVFP